MQTNAELERRCAELEQENAQLRAVQETLRNEIHVREALIESVTDYAIFGLDPKGNILTWNAGGERIKGYLPKEIIGQNFSQFYTQKDIHAHRPETELSLAATLPEHKYTGEGWRVRKDGSRFWASVTITALHDATGKLLGFSKITQDTTEQRRMEQTLRQTIGELEHLLHRA